MRTVSTIVLLLLFSGTAGAQQTSPSEARAEAEGGAGTEPETPPSSLDNDLRVAPDMFLERALSVRPRLELEQRFVVGSNFARADLDSYRTALSARVNLPLSEVVGVRLSGQASYQAYSGWAPSGCA